MTKPTVRIPETTIDKSRAERLKNELLIPAVDRLTQAGAWPDFASGIEIRILNGGMAKAGTKEHLITVNGMRTGVDWNDAFLETLAARTPKTRMEIDVSVNLFEDEIGARMVKLDADPLTTLAHFLAHEIFHLDEPERTRACGIKKNNRFTALAGGVRPDFPAPWLSAVIKLTETFPAQRKTPATFAKAFDIINECSADLIGLHWIREAKFDWKAYASKLIELRRADVARHAASPFIATPYDTADVLESILANGLPTPQEIHAQCWTLGIEHLLKTGALPASLTAMLANLPVLALPEQPANVKIGPINPTSHSAINGPAPKQP